VLVCPFCGAPETDRFVLEGRRFLVFRCLFTPEVAPGLGEEEIPRELRRMAEGGGAVYFRRMCDQLHLYVTQGEGARHLKESEGAGASTAKDPADPSVARRDG
jgi:hypothetical protein